MSKEDGREFNHGYAVDEFFIGNKEDSTVIAELTEEQQRYFNADRQMPSLKQIIAVGGISGVAAEGLILGGAALSMPLWATATAVGGAYVGQVAHYAKTPIQAVRDRKKRNGLAHEVAEGNIDGLWFKKRDIKLNLPKTMLDEAVRFNSEQGPTAVLASELLESCGDDVFGLSTLESHSQGEVHFTVNPLHFVRSALLSTVRDKRGELIRDSYGSLELLYSSQQKLPDISMDRFAAFEGLRSTHERASHELVLGALGVYGTVRAKASVDIAERIGELYVERGEEKIIGDMERLLSPTAENISWQEIRNARAYLNGLEYLNDK